MASLHFFRFLLCNNKKPTKYNTNDILDHIWGLKSSQLTIKMRKHWYSMCDCHEVNNDNTIRFFWIDRSLSDEPYTGELGSDKRKPVNKQLYNPTFCLAFVNHHLLVTFRTNNGPSYNGIAEFLNRYIKYNTAGNKFKLTLTPITNNLTFNHITNKYKIKKAYFTINPKIFETQGSSNNKLRKSIGGFSKLLDSKVNNKKATPNLTIKLNHGLFKNDIDYTLISYLRHSLVNNDYISEFGVTVKDPNDGQTKSINLHKENSNLRIPFDLSDSEATKEFASNEMFRYYRENKFPDKVMDSNYQLKPVRSVAIRYIDNPKGSFIRIAKNKGNKKS